MASTPDESLKRENEVLKALLMQAWLYLPFKTEAEKDLHDAIARQLLTREKDK